MSSIDVTKKIKWHRIPRVTGLSSAAGGNSNRYWTLEYEDGTAVLAINYDERVDWNNPATLSAVLYSKGQGTKHIYLKPKFNVDQLSECKKYYSELYKQIASSTEGKLYDYKIRLGWDK